jgi:hypothetical protein
MSELCLSKKESKIAYNWFFHGFKDWKKNDLVQLDDEVLMNKIEDWLIDNDE